MKTRLLIIGEDNLFRSRLFERLKLESFHVYLAEADCRPDIKKIIKRNKIDVVVIDLSNLRMDGVMILESIHGSRVNAEVVLINSADQLSLSIEGMKLGAHNDYLLPLDIEAFISGIREAADTKIRKRKKSFLKKYQDTMAAVAFAEAGEADMAKKFLEQKVSKPSKVVKENCKTAKTLNKLN